MAQPKADEQVAKVVENPGAKVLAKVLGKLVVKVVAKALFLEKPRTGVASASLGTVVGAMESCDMVHCCRIKGCYSTEHPMIRHGGAPASG